LTGSEILAKALVDIKTDYRARARTQQFSQYKT
jgi:hypothetical protein